MFNYWSSIRGDRAFPPIRDLDPLEISDAGPCSVLLEVMGGGDDADIRHLGHTLKVDGQKIERISEAPRPSLLACIASQLPIVASSRQPIAFEDNFPSGDSTAHCWVTLLPFSSTGKWIDYVYGFVTLKGAEATAEDEAETAEEVAEAAPEILDEVVEAEPEVAEEAEAVEKPVEEVGELEAPEPEAVEPEAEYVEEAAYEPEPEPAPEAKPRRPGFSAKKIFDALAGRRGLRRHIVKMDPKLPSEAELEPEPEYAEQEAEPEAIAEEEPAAEIEEDIVEEAVEPEPEPEPEAVEELAEEATYEEEITAEQPAEESVDTVADEPAVTTTSAPEGTLQNKLAEVRSKADEARMAKIRSNLALYEGLSAAYDFALDAEDNADEYLKLVEGQGLKI